MGTRINFSEPGWISLLFSGFIFFTSCEKLFIEEDPDNSPLSIFNQVWEFADREYCYFEYKGIDWDSVYQVYKGRISSDMNDEELFSVLSDMLFLLEDGHVNLVSEFDQSRNWSWYLNYPPNYSFSILERSYFDDRQQYAGPFILVDFGDVGYIHYRSFGEKVDEADMDYLIGKFEDHEAVIIDVRNNGGGSVSNMMTIASCFTSEKSTIAKIRKKTGPGHSDFGDLIEVTLDPADKTWEKPVVVLSNRYSYSATNYFISAMKNFEGVSIVGDRSGGGGGIPAYTELSNGWIMRVSSTRIYSSQGEDIESGIEPDYKIDITGEDMINGVDSILEFAFELIRAEADN